MEYSKQLDIISSKYNAKENSITLTDKTTATHTRNITLPNLNIIQHSHLFSTSTTTNSSTSKDMTVEYENSNIAGGGYNNDQLLQATAENAPIGVHEYVANSLFKAFFSVASLSGGIVSRGFRNFSASLSNTYINGKIII